MNKHEFLGKLNGVNWLLSQIPDDVEIIDISLNPFSQICLDVQLYNGLEAARDAISEKLSIDAVIEINRNCYDKNKQKLSISYPMLNVQLFQLERKTASNEAAAEIA